jgi:hypothetical protein
MLPFVNCAENWYHFLIQNGLILPMVNHYIVQVQKSSPSISGMQFVGTNLDAKPKGGILIQPSSQLIKTVIPNALYPAKEVAFLLVRNPTGGSTQEESTFPKNLVQV